MRFFTVDPTSKLLEKCKEMLSFVAVRQKTQSQDGLRVDSPELEAARAWAWKQDDNMADEQLANEIQVHLA